MTRTTTTDVAVPPAADSVANPKWMTILGWVLTLAPAAMLIMSGVMKVTSAEMVTKGFADQGYPQGVHMPIGIAELVSTAVYLIPQTAVLGAILLTGYMGGAINTHVRLAEPIYIQILIGVAIWLAIFLREPRLRRLIPWRT
jgi:uncharacterized membrane protein YphA (DoxX/SURF4 family)